MLNATHRGSPPPVFVELLVIDESIAFIRKNRERPFFLNLWNYTVHWPMEAKKAMLAKYAGREGPGIRDIRYAAMIECLDEAIGRSSEKRSAIASGSMPGPSSSIT